MKHTGQCSKQMAKCQKMNAVSPELNAGYDPSPPFKAGFILGVSVVTPPTTGLLNNPAKLGFINISPWNPT